MEHLPSYGTKFGPGGDWIGQALPTKGSTIATFGIPRGDDAVFVTGSLERGRCPPTLTYRLRALSFARKLAAVLYGRWEIA